MLNRKRIMKMCLVTAGLFAFANSSAMTLDSSCTVNILNRTVQVNQDGSWAMPNVPSFMGRVRARATCLKDGETISGQSDFFNVVANTNTRIEDISFDDLTPIPQALDFVNSSLTLSSATNTAQLVLHADFSDGSSAELSSTEEGLNYISSNPDIVMVSDSGVVTAANSGNALITARFEGVIALLPIVVSLSGDMDGDGLPDDYEIANGLDPNDPIDAFEDQDKDGLSALEEFNAGTNLNVADSDGDGIADGEELVEGEDGFITNPLLADTDGDGLRDGLEVLVGSNPTDANSTNLGDAIDSIEVRPGKLDLIFNSIDTEVSDTVRVVAHLLDESEMDITDDAEYASSDLSVASFGLNKGEIFGGQGGSAVLTVSYLSFSDSINVVVDRFDPIALSTISIPGYANNVDIQGDTAFVAAGDAGLVIVDVSDREEPSIISQLDTNGISIDIKVIGDTVYLADGAAGLKVIDVSDLSTPVLLSSYVTGGVAKDLAVDIDYAYVADGDNGLVIVDISNPEEPFAASYMSGLGDVKGVDVSSSMLVLVSDKQFHVMDISDRLAPVQLSTLNIAKNKNIVFDGRYAYLANYSNGYTVVDVAEPASPVVVGGESVIVPRDLALRDGILLFAEQLFPNVVALVNVQDPDNATFQATVDLSSLGDYAGTGIAVDSSYVYVTEESVAVSLDYKANGDTKLFIAQYRSQFDDQGIAPTVSLEQPLPSDTLVEDTRLVIEAEADDDIAVKEVQFIINDEVVFTDSSAPYQLPYFIAKGVSALSLSARAVDLAGNESNTDTFDYAVQADADNDDLGDTEEVVTYSTKLDDADSDDDGLNDGREVRLGTDPNNGDSDGDGLKDGVELQQGTDPLNPDITAPEVASITPAEDAVDVRESSAVEVLFNEVLNRRTVSQQTISLIETDTNVEVAGGVRLSSDNKTLIYEADSLLKDYTQYTVTVSGVRDLAGNPISEAFISQFSTGNYVDTERPYVSLISPIGGAVDVPVNTVIDMQFNEKLDEASISSNNIYLYDTKTGSRVSTQLTISDDRKQISLIPDVALPLGRRFYVYVSGVKDLYANILKSKTYEFTTGFDVDVTAPEIIAMSVSDGYQDVPTNAVLQIGFDEAISGIHLAGLNLYKQGARETELLVSRTLSDNNRVVTLVLSRLLDANMGYELEISNIEDTSGNIMVDEIHRFETASGQDLTTLDVIEHSPYPYEYVPSNTEIWIEYNDRVNSLTASNIALYDETDRVWIEVDWFVYKDNEHKVRIVPKRPLLAGHEFQITNTSSPYVNGLTGTGENKNYHKSYFYVIDEVDEEELKLVDVNIGDGTTGIPLNSQIVLDFDNVLNDIACSVNAGVILRDSSGSEVAYEFEIIDGKNRKYNRTRLIITPKNGLIPRTTYTLSINGLCDSAGNEIEPLSHVFTTGGIVDTTNPGLESIVPMDGLDNVSVTSPIVLTFTEPVWFDEYFEYNYAFEVLCCGRVSLAGSYEWSEDHRQLTFTPSGTYPVDTRIDFYLNSSIKDLANNPYSGATSFYFTTESGISSEEVPNIVQVIPNDGAIDIDVSNNIILTFSETLNPATVHSDKSVALYANGERLSDVTARMGDDNRTVIISSSSIPNNSLVSVVVSSEVQDLAGNHLPDFVSVYTTSASGNTNRPSVTTVYPGNGANDVSADKSIILYTSEALDASTVTNNSFYISENGILVDGEIEVFGDGRGIRFTPGQALRPDAYIEVFAQSGIRDLSGYALNNYQSAFRTSVDSSMQVPKLISRGNTEDLPLNAVLSMAFSEALDESSINPSSVRLIEYSRDGHYSNITMPASLELMQGGRVLRIIPDEDLIKNSQYRIHIDGVLDLDGDAVLKGDYPYYTALNAMIDDISPNVVEISPVDGAKDIGINSSIHIGFDERINPIGFDARLLTRPVTQSVSFGLDNKSVTYIPHEPFPSDSEVVINVPPVEDDAGNVLNEYSVRFDTDNGIDVTGPIVSHITPSHYKSNVAVNSVISILFNEDVAPHSVHQNSIRLYDPVLYSEVSGTISLASDNRTVTFFPTEALVPNRRYYVRVYGSLLDMSGNRYADISSSKYDDWYFTTSSETDDSPPELIGMSILDGYKDVPTNAILQMRFSEAISGVYLKGLNIFEAGSSEAEILTSRALSNGYRDVILKTSRLLKSDTVYELRASGVKDTSGNVMTGEAIIRFTTGAGANLGASSIVRRTPYANDTDVPLNTNIRFEYNNRINPLTLGRIYLLDKTVGGYIKIRSVVEGDNNQVVRLIPEENLSAGHQFEMGMPLVTGLTGIGADSSVYGKYYFFTAAEPDQTIFSLIGSNISDGYTGVPLNGQITLNFNKSLDYIGCPIYSAVNLYDDFGNPIAYDWEASSTHDLKHLVVAPKTNFISNVNYTLSVDGLCDYVGNSLSETQEWSFTTGDLIDTSRPELESILPENGATGVGVNSSIVVRFSEPVWVTGLIEERIYAYLGHTSNKLPGRYIWNSDHSQLTFIPTNDYPSKTKISFRFNYTDVKDLAGKTFRGSSFISFTTE